MWKNFKYGKYKYKARYAILLDTIFAKIKKSVILRPILSVYFWVY